MSLPNQGVVPAVWTPTNARGELMKGAFERHLAFLAEKGVAGVMVLGTTGEFLLVDPKVRLEVFECAQAACHGLPIVANISHCRLDTVLSVGARVREMGIESISVLPPWYYVVCQDDLVEFLARAGGEVGLPFMIYNFPERTGNALTAETIAAVAKRTPVWAVKHSGVEVGYVRELREALPGHPLKIFVGREPFLPEAMELGADGTISGMANAIPDVLVEFHHALRTGDEAKAQSALEKIRHVNDLLHRVDFPLNIAASMEGRGFDPGAPKRPLSSTTEEAYRSLVGDFRAFYRQWKLD